MLLCRLIAIPLAPMAPSAMIFTRPPTTAAKQDDCYIPGSVLRAGLRPSPLTREMGETLDVVFDDSSVFAVAPEDTSAIVTTWDDAKPLRSGWAWGQERLKGNAAIVDFPVGLGRAVLSGRDLNFRGQSYASFRILLAAFFRSAESDQSR